MKIAGFGNMNKRISRRAVVKKSALLFGAGLIGRGSAAKITDNNPDNFFNVKDFGATGNRTDKSTRSFQSAIEACTLAGGGTVYVPPGEYSVGTLELRDNVNLHIEAGASLFLSQDKNDIIRGKYAMIYAEKVKNISVTGKGTMDGLAQYEFTEMDGIDPEIAEEIEIARKAGEDMRRYYRIGVQTYMFILNECTNVLLEDISVINSPLWNVRLNDCDRVFVRGVYIYSDLEKGVNADGIDICCSKNVTISDSVIVTADDAIVLKTPERRGKEGVNPTENIVVTNCVLTSSSTPLMIGTETLADIRHVIFSNCTIRNSNKGFGINVQDGCTVSDIIFSNLTIETSRRHWNWWGSAELCKFILRKREDSSKLGQIRDILVENIISHVRGTSSLTGHPEQPLENIRMYNVRLFMEPEDSKAKRATDAMKLENVRDLKIRDLEISWNKKDAEPKWQSALVLDHVSEFEILYFSGRQGLPGSSFPGIVMSDVSNGLIAESKATDDCGTFVKLSGKNNSDLTLRNLNVKKAVRLIDYEDDTDKKAVEIK
jgi:hypothetical protein